MLNTTIKIKTASKELYLSQGVENGDLVHRHAMDIQFLLLYCLDFKNRKLILFY